VGSEVIDYKVGDCVVTTGEHAQYLLMDEMNCTPAPKGIDMYAMSIRICGPVMKISEYS